MVKSVMWPNMGSLQEQEVTGFGQLLWGGGGICDPPKENFRLARIYPMPRGFIPMLNDDGTHTVCEAMIPDRII